MNTAAKTLVGAGHNNKGFLFLPLVGFGLGFLEDGVGSLAVGSRLSHRSLGLIELGRGNDFHRFGDFLDVANGFETAFDFSERCIVGRRG